MRGKVTSVYADLLLFSAYAPPTSPDPEPGTPPSRDPPDPQVFAGFLPLAPLPLPVGFPDPPPVVPPVDNEELEPEALPLDSLRVCTRWLRRWCSSWRLVSRVQPGRWDAPRDWASAPRMCPESRWNCCRVCSRALRAHPPGEWVSGCLCSMQKTRRQNRHSALTAERNFLQWAQRSCDGVSCCCWEDVALSDLVVVREGRTVVVRELMGCVTLLGGG